MDAVTGDRRQTLVVIGLHLDKELMQRAFEHCLLTDEEMGSVRIARTNDQGVSQLYQSVEAAAEAPDTAGPVTNVSFELRDDLDEWCARLLPMDQ